MKDNLLCDKMFIKNSFTRRKSDDSKKLYLFHEIIRCRCAFVTGGVDAAEACGTCLRKKASRSLETADLFGLIYENQIVLLQKKELLLGTADELTETLKEKTTYEKI